MQTNILEDWDAAKANRTGAVFGAVLGLFPPLAAFTIVHTVLHVKRWQDLQTPYTVVVVGAMLFSISTVYEWGRAAFDSRWKAVWLVATYEGAMVIVVDPLWLSGLALAYLVGINAIATACNIARKYTATATPTPELELPASVTQVARELNVGRRAAAKLIDRQRSPA